MYRLLRTIHLYVGLVLLSFVLMYFVTGYLMIHHEWVPDTEAQSTTRTEPLTYTGDAGLEGVSIFLQTEYGLEGRRVPPQRQNNGQWRFQYYHPGTHYDARINVDGDSVTIIHTAESPQRIINGFHRMRGYGGGHLYDAWTLFYDLASLALVVFPLTGILMWYTLTRRHGLGWICLLLSFGYAAATILYLMVAR